MKKGYSVSIHYETPEDAEEDTAINTIKKLLEQPELNSLHLYIKKTGLILITANEEIKGMPVKKSFIEKIREFFVKEQKEH